MIRRTLSLACALFANLVGLIVLIGFGLLWLTAVDALINAPKPTERCFPVASGGEYCRAQTTWSIGND